MPQLPSDIREMLRAGNIRPQVLRAVEELKKELGATKSAHGRAYEICQAWQRRFELALQSEIPEWVGLAAFRCIIDFNLPLDRLGEIFPSRPADSDGADAPDCPRVINTFEEVWRAYRHYLEEKRDLHSGKFLLKSDAMTYFLQRLNKYEPMPGGQAGNILWLWHCIGTDPIAYAPYFFEDLARLSDKFPGLADLKLQRFENGESMLQRLGAIKDQAGVRKSDGSRVGAPSGGSVIVVKDGRRLIYQFMGVRDIRLGPGMPAPWKKVQFVFEGKELLTTPIERADIRDVTWPGLSLFSECHIDEKSETLIIRLAGEEEVKQAFGGKADFAILGGIESIFRDDWIKKDPILQARLLAVAERQLRALATCGIRIGVELSGIPGREYAHFIQSMCREEVIVAIGINGVDELPDVVGEKIVADHQLYEFWLDPETVDPDLLEEVRDPKSRGDHFEYVTYLRAKKLAEATGVRTLYAHTMTLDLVLRRDADPGALLRAQLGDMMGKGLVLTALLKRAYGDKWRDELKVKLSPAIKPEAMAKLYRFAKDFGAYSRVNGASDRLLHSGYWIAPSLSQYSVAAIPVMWPHVSETDVSEKSQVKELLDRLNTTGSGDMTFGAIFLLGGL